MMKYAGIRRFFSTLRLTPFHPQWFASRHRMRYFHQLSEWVYGNVLDIGCANQQVKAFLGTNCRYIGLDYYQTATGWYKTRPHVFGDAEDLPVLSESIDCILLLDVLEHIAEPDRCLAEIHRVLKPGGTFVLGVPFLYPLHDRPRDFQRWTAHGLESIVGRYGFLVSKFSHAGEPLETAALLSNIAASRVCLKWIERGSPFSLFAVFLPCFVFLTNITAWSLRFACPQDDLMPTGYFALCRKCQ